jgi:hypothetical protein
MSLLDYSNPRRLMATPHGLRTVEELYESLDNCITMHKTGRALVRVARAYLEDRTGEALMELDHALWDHDIALTYATRLTEHRPPNGHVPTSNPEPVKPYEPLLLKKRI